MLQQGISRHLNRHLTSVSGFSRKVVLVPRIFHTNTTVPEIMHAANQILVRDHCTTSIRRAIIET